jgi:hypothetical protein
MKENRKKGDVRKYYDRMEKIIDGDVDDAPLKWYFPDKKQNCANRQ